MAELVLREDRDGLTILTLNRPEKLNALTMKMQAELSEALWQADNDRAVHCVIIKGAGRGFSAGYDLAGDSAVPVSRLDPDTENKRGGRSVDDDIWQLERAQRYRMAIFDMHKPVIAQIHGPCVAGGCDIALLCDFVIIADDAKVSFPAGRNLGALPNQMWLYHVGPQWTKRLMLTGDSITGAEAAQLGFAMKSVQPDLLEAEVEGLASRMALIDADILAANKRAVNLGMELMGARTMQRLAVENDVRGHQAASAHAFVKRVGEAGLKTALQERDGPFGDGRVKVNGPEIRDADGWLVED